MKKLTFRPSHSHVFPGRHGLTAKTIRDGSSVRLKRCFPTGPDILADHSSSSFCFVLGDRQPEFFDLSCPVFQNQ